LPGLMERYIKAPALEWRFSLKHSAQFASITQTKTRKKVMLMIALVLTQVHDFKKMSIKINMLCLTGVIFWYYIRYFENKKP